MASHTFPIHEGIALRPNRSFCRRHIFCWRMYSSRCTGHHRSTLEPPISHHTCWAGFFCPNATTQQPCDEPGFYCGSGSSAPTECPAGSYCPAGADTPVACPDGLYCPAGAGEPVPCPAYSTPTESGDACVCSLNHFAIIEGDDGSTRSLQCLPCNNGLVCGPGQVWPNISLAAGFWQDKSWVSDPQRASDLGAEACPENDGACLGGSDWLACKVSL